jgi:hypothetical protein
MLSLCNAICWCPVCLYSLALAFQILCLVSGLPCLCWGDLNSITFHILDGGSPLLSLSLSLDVFIPFVRKSGLHHDPLHTINQMNLREAPSDTLPHSWLQASASHVFSQASTTRRPRRSSGCCHLQS